MKTSFQKQQASSGWISLCDFALQLFSMFRGARAARSRFFTALKMIGLTTACWISATNFSSAEISPIEITNVLQVVRIASRESKSSCVFHLEGTALWANPARGKIILQDASGAEELEFNSREHAFRSGARIRIEGVGTIARRGTGFQLGAKGAVVDNNGIHSSTEKSGVVYLKSGPQPLRLEWFNGVEKYGLTVDFEGPDLPRRRIPDSALMRAKNTETNGRAEFVPGLNFRCYEFAGEALPDFDQIAPVKSGVVSNFDLGVITRPEHVAV
ncbi:MAG TPA: hypothetical protein VFM25_04590, partial [Verrucomicrobiae bacterium]|nr:hypothetical protein [Verrucomicrobiae bacterium]